MTCYITNDMWAFSSIHVIHMRSYEIKVAFLKPETISAALCDQWSCMSDYWDDIWMTFGILWDFMRPKSHKIPNSWDSVYFIPWASVLAFLPGLRLQRLNKNARNDIWKPHTSKEAVDFLNYFWHTAKTALPVHSLFAKYNKITACWVLTHRRPHCSLYICSSKLQCRLITCEINARIDGIAWSLSAFFKV